MYIYLQNKINFVNMKYIMNINKFNLVILIKLNILMEKLWLTREN